MSVQVGPCAPWDAVWGNCELSAASTALTGIALQAASELLWSLSGQRFGLCTVTLRPCKRTCSDVSWPSNTWPSSSYGWSYPMPVNMGGGEWINLVCGSCTRDCSCVPLEEVLLPAPVHDIVEIKVDGTPLVTGSYRVDNWRIVVRTDGGEWPQCNDLTKEDTEVDTWSITARFGEEVPLLGTMAAGELACQFARFLGGEECLLPPNVTALTRQGISMTLVDPTELNDSDFMGLRLVDMFIKTYNPHGLRARAKVYDVDRPYIRITGT